jgi:hypothetical protein
MREPPAFDEPVEQQNPQHFVVPLSDTLGEQESPKRPWQETAPEYQAVQAPEIGPARQERTNRESEEEPFREGYPKGYDESKSVSFVERYCSKNVLARYAQGRDPSTPSSIIVEALPKSLVENPPLMSPEADSKKGNLGRKSIKQLRTLCDNEDLDHSDCIDKIDLVVLLKDNEATERREESQSPKDEQNKEKAPKTRSRSLSLMSMPELMEECKARDIDISELNRRGSCSKRLDLAVAIAQDDEMKKVLLLPTAVVVSFFPCLFALCVN